MIDHRVQPTYLFAVENLKIWMSALYVHYMAQYTIRIAAEGKAAYRMH